MKTTRAAFEAGWLHGHRYKRYQSPREVVNAHPGLSWELASVYLNGQDDGIRGDRFRLEIGAESSLKNGLRSSRSRRQHAGAVTGMNNMETA